MTSKEGRTVRDDGKSKERTVREDVLLFDVIPGPPQAEPGIQRLGSNGLLRALSRGRRPHLRGTRLDSGSVLRTVRDDDKRGTGRPG